MENEEVIKEVGTELTIVDPTYVLKPSDDQAVSTLVGEIQGFLQSGGGVTLPKNYDANGALKSLYLALLQNHENDTDKQKGISLWAKCNADPQRRLELMTAAREYVMNGLNVTKGQCYFYLAKGGKYKLDISYKGYEMLAKRNCNVEFRNYVLHEGDKITMKTLEETGEQIAFPDINPMNRNKPIVGALAIAIKTFPNGKRVQDRYLYMSWTELCQSRDKGVAGGSPAYRMSGELMYGKLVVKALAKQYFKTTDDADSFGDEGYYVSGEYDNQFQDKSKEEYTPASRGGMTIQNADGSSVEQADVQYWYDNSGTPHQLLPDEMFTPYLNKDKQKNGERYPGTFVGYCKNTRRAVCKKSAEVQE